MLHKSHYLRKGVSLIFSCNLKTFLGHFLIFPALNQLQEPDRNADTQCQDEGIGKRLKSHPGASQAPEEREKKEGDQKQKEKGQMCTCTTHRARAKIKTGPYVISSVVFCAKHKYDKPCSMQQTPFPGPTLIPKTLDIRETPHVPTAAEQIEPF